MVRGKMSNNEFEACEYLQAETIETLLLEGSKVNLCLKYSKTDLVINKLSASI